VAETPKKDYHDPTIATIDITYAVGNPTVLRAWADLVDAVRMAHSGVHVELSYDTATLWRRRTAGEVADAEATAAANAEANLRYRVEREAERIRLAAALNITVEELTAREAEAKLAGQVPSAPEREVPGDD